MQASAQARRGVESRMSAVEFETRTCGFDGRGEINQPFASVAATPFNGGGLARRMPRAARIVWFDQVFSENRFPLARKARGMLFGITV
jgi:hypothetical protein